jgi:hypothetical protein
MKPPRFGVLVLVTALLSPGRNVAQDKLPANDQTVELPAFEVAGKFPAEGWVYSRLGSTEILSELPAKETRAFADDFVTFREFVQAQYPEAAPPPEQRVLVVLCNRTAGYRGFGGSPDNDSKTLSAEHGFILIDASQLTVDQYLKAARRRLVAVGFQSHAAGRYPLWRELGMREILAQVRIGDNRLEIGYPPFFSEGTRTPGGWNQFNNNMVLPMDTVFTVTREIPGFGGRDTSQFWNLYAQSTAFSHMCLFGVRYRKFREPYQKFITRLETEPFSAKLFQECFEMDLAEMNRVLRQYATGGTSMKYETRSYKFPPTSAVEVRPARPIEVLRMVRESRQLIADRSP